MTQDAERDGWWVLFWIVFTRSRNPMLLADGERRMVEVNPALIEFTGYAREQLVGSRIDRFLAPDEWRSIDAEWRAFQSRGTYEGERSVVRADGRAVPVQYAGHWARVDDRPRALYVVLNADLEPLRLADEELPAAEVLTPRELEVVGRVAMGERAHEIAEALGIAPSTVRSHVRSAMRKSHARSQAQLVAIVCAGRLPGSPPQD